ncbi:MAG TPA: inositol monophosphatase [Syntrophobacteraceae bacterium]|nr:inositol monophosphatase [Syntrophobacteraceae bacterium]
MGGPPADKFCSISSGKKVITLLEPYVSIDLDRAEAVALEAITTSGRLVAEHFGNGSAFTVELKRPFDYVTDVDRRSEDLIVDMILDHFGDHHILAEERSEINFPSGPTWIVDPLDGTTNFIHSFPFVAISIALMVEGQVVLGMVYDPLRQELFRARRRQGAFLNGVPIRVRNVTVVGDALMATGFPVANSQLIEPYMETLREVLQGVSGVRRAGAAALDLAYLACGRVDGFWEIGLKPWDIAAGSLLVEESGGTVSDFWGEQKHLNCGHIVAGGPMAHAFLLHLVKSHLALVLEKP